jgi:hypothetical protein
MTIILATWEAEIRRITVQSQWANVHEALSRKKKTLTKKGWWSSTSRKSAYLASMRS